MQSGRTTNTGGGTMAVVAAALRCQLLLIVLMAAMLLPGMKGSPLLVQRTVTRTIVLQETIGKEFDLLTSSLPWKSSEILLPLRDFNELNFFTQAAFPSMGVPLYEEVLTI
ncbi:hypothetical protein STEG23_012999 [Scotinomys teguina]